MNLFRVDAKHKQNWRETDFIWAQHADAVNREPIVFTPPVVFVPIRQAEPAHMRTFYMYVIRVWNAWMNWKAHTATAANENWICIMHADCTEQRQSYGLWTNSTHTTHTYVLITYIFFNVVFSVKKNDRNISEEFEIYAAVNKILCMFVRKRYTERVLFVIVNNTHFCRFARLHEAVRCKAVALVFKRLSCMRCVFLCLRIKKVAAKMCSSQ